MIRGHCSDVFSVIWFACQMQVRKCSNFLEMGLHFQWMANYWTTWETHTKPAEHHHEKRLHCCLENCRLSVFLSFGISSLKVHLAVWRRTENLWENLFHSLRTRKTRTAWVIGCVQNHVTCTTYKRNSVCSMCSSTASHRQQNLEQSGDEKTLEKA